jgi:F0F1-type ATP synthase membrane subunit b/b'
MKFVFFDRVAAVIDQREGHIKDKLVASKKAQDKIEEEISNQNPKELLAQAKSSSSSILNEAMNIATIQPRLNSTANLKLALLASKKKKLNLEKASIQ